MIRPLLKFDKKDLIYISKKIFSSYIEDPSNQQDRFKRVKIRTLIKNLQSEGLDFDKFDLTIQNLQFANKSINFFIEKNISENSTILDNNKTIIINKDFFNYPEEVVFRSISKIIKIVGKKFYSARGKKICYLLNLIHEKSFLKTSLGNCLIKKVNQSIIITKEH